MRFPNGIGAVSPNFTTTHGVRIFTVVIVSGSLFHLIYKIGRKRMDHPPESARETRLTRKLTSGTGPHSKRYLSNNYEKSYPQVSSTSEAVEQSTRSQINKNGQTGGSSSYRTEHVYEESGSDLSDSDSETANPYIFSSIDAAFRYGARTKAKKRKAQLVTEAEQSFLDHLGRRSYKDVPSNCDRRTSPGDLSSLEKRIQEEKHDSRHNDVAKSSTSSDAPRFDLGSPSAKPLKDHDVLLPERILIETKQEMHSLTYYPIMAFAKPLLYCSIWCILNQSFSVFTRTSMGAKMVTFPAPFFKLTVHFVIQSILASCMLRWPMKKVFYTSWTTSLLRVMPVAVAATMDHEPQATPFCSVYENINAPFSMVLKCQSGGSWNDFRKVFRETTLAAVCYVQSKSKALVPVIVFLLGTRFKFEGQNHVVFPNVIIISVGFILTAYNEEEVESWSLTKLSLGSVVSAFRLVGTQNLLQVPGLSNMALSRSHNQEYLLVVAQAASGLVSPVVTMRALAPAMAAVTTVLSYLVDPWSTLRQTEFFNTPERSVLTWAHITVGAFLETSVALAELVVIYHTSANTMIIFCMLKEVTLLMIGRFQRDDYTRFNAIGIGVFFLGIVSYVWVKYRKMIKRVRFQDDPWSIRMPTGEGSSSLAARSSFFPTDFLTRTRTNIRTEVSNCVDRVSQMNGSLRIIGRDWRDRFSSFRRFRRE